MSMLFTLSTAGVAAIQSAQSSGIQIRVTTFAVGSAYNYTPSPLDTGLRGTTLYTGPAGTFSTISINTIQYQLVLDQTIGTFNFGEVALFLSDGTFFALASNPTLTTKIVAAGTDPGNYVVIAGQVSYTNVLEAMTFSFSSPYDLTFYTTATVDGLPQAGTAITNMYVSTVGDDIGNPTLCTLSTTPLWNFNTHNSQKYTNLVALAGGTSTSVNVTGPLVTETPGTGKYIVQFTSGANMGLCRSVTAVTSTVISWGTALSTAPSVGDTFNVYQSNLSYAKMRANSVWTWDSVTSFVAGNHVLAPDSKEYIAVQGSTGQNPSTDYANTYWKLSNVLTTYDTQFSEDVSTSGLNLVIAAGTMYNQLGSTITVVTPTTITLPANSISYVEYDTTSKTVVLAGTKGFFTPGNFPIGKVTTGASTITSYLDRRTPFSVTNKLTPEGRWQQLITGDLSASRLSGYASWSFGSALYVFGGYDPATSVVTNNLYSFDTTSLSWSAVATLGTAPPVRFNAASFVWQGNLYVFGGQAAVAPGSLNYNSVWYFNIVTSTWVQLNTTGTPPVVRNGAAACVIGNVAYIFGGNNGNGTEYSDIFTLDLTTGAWSTLTSTGGPPSATRSLMTAGVYGGNIYVTYWSGAASAVVVWKYTVSSNTWSQPSVSGTIPVALYGTSGDQLGNSIYAFSGETTSSSGAYSQSVYRLNLQTLTWVAYPSTAPGGRIGHQSRFVGSELYVLMGTVGPSNYTDFWRMS